MRLLVVAICWGGVISTSSEHSHEWSDWSVVTAPTETSAGKAVKTCKTDSSHTEELTLPALTDAAYTHATVTAPTCTAAGSEKYTITSSGTEFSFTVELAATGHTNVAHCDSVSPTCDTAGNTEYWYCADCGTYFTDEALTISVPRAQTVTAALGHTYTNETVDEKYLKSSATCTEAAVYYKSCKDCGAVGEETFTYGELAAHTYGELVAAKDATCTEAGAKAHYQCPACGTYFDSDKNATTEADLKIDALGHEWDEGEVTSQPTCSENGVKTYHCTHTGCSETRTEPVDTIAHDYSAEFTVDVAATCTEKGSKSKHCSQCDATTDVTEIPALGHEWGEWTKGTDPTTSSAGTLVRSCTHEGCSEKDTATIPQLNTDNYDITYSTLNCAEEATVTYSYPKDGTINGEAYSGAKFTYTTTKAAGEHMYGNWTVTASTAENAGSAVRTCSVGTCGYEDTVELPALTDENIATYYNVTTTPATCTENGLSVYKLKTNETITFNVTLTSPGHTYGELVTAKDATCVEQGNVAYYQCSVCEKYFNSDKEEIDSITTSLIDHNYSDETAEEKYLASEATCTAKAEYYKSCSVCGAKGTETFEYGDLAEHTYANVVGDAYLISAATCTAKAKYYKSCSVCGAMGTETFDYGELADHDYGDLIAEAAATCGEDGMAAHYYCSTCEKYFNSSKEEVTSDSLKLSATGAHTYGSLVDAKEKTCTEDGMKAYYQCSVCSKYFDSDKNETTAEELVIAAGHKYEYVIAKDPDLTTAGTASYVCSVCGDKSSTQKWIMNLSDDNCGSGNTYTKTVVKAPTCTDKGITYYYCEAVVATDGTVLIDEPHTFVLTTAATGHTLADGATKCSVCGYSSGIGYDKTATGQLSSDGYLSLENDVVYKISNSVATNAFSFTVPEDTDGTYTIYVKDTEHTAKPKIFTTKGLSATWTTTGGSSVTVTSTRGALSAGTDYCKIYVNQDGTETSVTSGVSKYELVKIVFTDIVAGTEINLVLNVTTSVDSYYIGTNKEISESAGAQFISAGDNTVTVAEDETTAEYRFIAPATKTYSMTIPSGITNIVCGEDTLYDSENGVKESITLYVEEGTVYAYTFTASASGDYTVTLSEAFGYGVNIIEITDNDAYADSYTFTPTETKTYSLTVPSRISLVSTDDGETTILDTAGGKTYVNFEATAGTPITFAFQSSYKCKYPVTIGDEVVDTTLLTTTNAVTITFPGTSGGRPAKVYLDTNYVEVTVGKIEEGTYTLTFMAQGEEGAGIDAAGNYYYLDGNGIGQAQIMISVNGTALKASTCTSDTAGVSAILNNGTYFTVTTTLKAGDVVRVTGGPLVNEGTECGLHLYAGKVTITDCTNP